MSQRRVPYGARAAGMREVDASKETRRTPPEEVEPHKQGGGNREKKEIAEWQAIKADLISIKEGLEKDKGVNHHFARRLGKVIARVPHATRRCTTSLEVEARLDRIEGLL